MKYFLMLLYAITLPSGLWAQSNRLVNQEVFTNTLKEFNYLFSTDVKQHTGKKLKVSGDWKNNSSQAYSYQKLDESRIHINGGTLNRFIQNQDQLRLLLCHELGHIMSGRFYQIRSDSKMNPIEGYADYFATNYCMNQFKYDYKRIAEIAFSFSLSLANEMGEDLFSIHDRDHSVITKTNHSYSSALCRYTTFMAGIENNMFQMPTCWFVL